MTADLYRALGVDRGCSRAEVRRGYRRASKAAHPDGGGSKERFALVRLAHDVLTDDARRARYDAEGVIEETAPDTRWALAMNMLAGVLDHVVSQSSRPEAVDLVDLAKACLHEKIRQLDGQKAGFVATVAKWKRLERRFERRGEGENMIAAIIRSKLDALGSMIGQCEAQAGQAKQALELLSDYRFVVEKPELGARRNPLIEQMMGLRRQTGSVW